VQLASLMIALNQPPGPSDPLMIKNLIQFKHNPLRFLEKCARRYGDIVKVRFGPHVLYLLNHPRYIEKVLSDSQTFVKSTSNLDVGGIFGNGMFTSKGKEWLEQRREIQGAFHRECLIGYTDVLINCAECLIGEWRDGEVRDLHHEMNLLTLRAIARALFGFNQGDEADELEATVEAVEVVLDRYRMEFPVPVNPMLLFPTAFPIPANLRLGKAIGRIRQLAASIIQRRKSEEDPTINLLSILLRKRGRNGWKDKFVLDQVVTFLLTGHETTACALAWTWYLLALFPTKLAKLNEEVDRLAEGRPVTAADFDSLSYTRMVVMESLRMYPPSWGMNRIVVEDCQIGGYAVPAGTSVGMSQWVMHRDARFYEKPEDFRPERWTDEHLESLPRGAFFPFGTGQRVCIGQDFALLQLVFTLATIARKYKFQLVPGRTVEPQVSITLRPKGGILATLHRRHVA
jgi:cytochrome P450